MSCSINSDPITLLTGKRADLSEEAGIHTITCTVAASATVDAISYRLGHPDDPTGAAARLAPPSPQTALLSSGIPNLPLIIPGYADMHKQIPEHNMLLAQAYGVATSTCSQAVKP